MPSTDSHLTSPQLEAAIRSLLAAGDNWAQALTTCDRLVDEQAGEKQDAILRLMQQANPLAGTDKPHSASSAEKVAETDMRYAHFLAERRMATMARMKAEAEYYAARARAAYWSSVVAVPVMTLKGDPTWGGTNT